MENSIRLNLSDVEAMLRAAAAEADRNQWAVSIAVADEGGHPLGLLRLDGASPASAYIATEKARTAAMMRRETKQVEDMINNGRTAFVTVPVLQGVLEGGVPVVVGGRVVGAVGVSGVKAGEDAQISRAGIAALGQAN